MTTNHARCAARRVDENPVERPAVPPAVRRRGIAGHDLRGEPEAIEVLAHARDALGIAIDGPHVAATADGLEDVPGLAAGRRASVEHALARRKRKQRRRALSRDVL